MTVRAATINFTLYPYATFSETTTLRDSAGDPIDLTGFTALMHIRRELDDTVPMATLTTADGTIVLGDAAGTIVLALTPAVTAALPVEWEGESWVHDLLMKDGSNDEIQRTYQGAVFVRPGVTRGTPP